MKPNTLMLAITTRLITRSSAAIRRYHFPINIAVQPCGDLLGFTSFGPTYQDASHARAHGRHHGGPKKLKQAPFMPEFLYRTRFLPESIHYHSGPR